MKNLFVLLIVCFLLYGCGGIVKSSQKELEKMKTTQFRNDLDFNKPNDDYKVFINKDISGITAIKGEDSFLYKDMTYFDVYTRSIRINFGDSEFDNYFAIIPESWVKLYADDSGVYLNYIPVEVE